MDLLPGRIHVQFDFVATSIAHIRAGQLKALMTTHPRRIPVLPEVPAARELGQPELEIATMSGYLAPKGTPREIVNALHRILVAAIKSPEIERTFRERGAEPIGNSPEEFSAALAADRARWAEIVRQTGIRAQQ
jgi:tripartite-type tricarboxylate transporter receptor subunit TctC